MKNIKNSPNNAKSRRSTGHLHFSFERFSVSASPKLPFSPATPFLVLLSLGMSLATTIPAGAQLAEAKPAEAQSAVAFETEVSAAIVKVRARPLRTDQHTPWVIMHAAIAFERQHSVTTPEGETRNALSFLLDGARDTEKQTRLYQMQDDVPRIRTRGIAPGFSKSFILQDHVDQFLYCYADADLPLATKGKATRADGTDHAFTVQDLLNASLREFKPDQELGWSLVVSSHYLPIEKTWQTADGDMSTADVLALAVERDANRETEGGAHHLYGVAYALARYQQANPAEPLVGSWRAARAYLDKHLAIVKQFQNDDGSFSAMMFRKQSKARDARMMVWATGHTIEWMTVAFDSETLNEPWVRRAVLALAKTINTSDLDELSDGGMYHAAHALIRWREKTAKPK